MRSFVSDKKLAREGFSALLVALAILVFTGCATTGLDTSPDRDEAKEQSQLDDQGTQAGLKVTAINVVGQGDAVLIATNRPAKYTSFMLTSPPRLVIDLPEANLYDVLETTKVNNKYLKTINVVTYGGKEKIGRIIIELQDGVDHNVKNTEEGVLIELKHDPLANLPQGALEEGNVVVASSGNITLASSQAETEDEPMEPATTVEELKSYAEDSETVIQIISDGAVGKYNTFELSDPARVVIDVWDVTNKTGVRTLAVESEDIKDVRVGNHPDKVRFVIDLAGDDIPPYVVTKSGDHITVTFRPTQSESADEGVSDEGTTVDTPDEAAIAAEDDSGWRDGATPAAGLSNVAYDAGSAAATAAVPGVEAAGEAAGMAEEPAMAAEEPEMATDEATTGDVETSAAVEDETEGATTLEAARDETAQAEEAQTPAESALGAEDGAAEETVAAIEETASAEAEQAPDVVAQVETDDASAMEAATDGNEIDVSSALEESSTEIEEAMQAQREAEEAAAAAQEEEMATETVAPEMPALETETVAEPDGAVAEAEPEAAAEPAAEPASEPEAEPATEADVEPVAEVEAEPVAEAAPVQPVAGNTIKDITFKKMGGKGFLAIESTGKPTYTIKESKDHKTIVLDISDALISDDLVRTLDATKLGTPVAAISSYQSFTDPPVARVLISLAGNATHSVMELDGTLNLIFTPVEQKTAVSAAAADGTMVESGLKQPKYTGKKIDLDMMDARITDILRLLAEVSNLNIIASDDVKGTISLRLRDVPWDQAFDIILKAKGLDKIKVGNVIRVAPAARISQERDAALAAQKASEKLEPLSIEFVAINYAKAEELESHVKNVLSDRGSVTSEKRTNTLIIKDIKKGIRAAEQLVARLDTPIPQVLIEARIVEASSSFSRDLGIQWGVDYQTGGNVSTDVFGSGVDSTGVPAPGQTPPATTTSPTFETRNGVQNFAVNLPATGSIGTLGALGFILGKAGQNPLVLDLRLSAGEQEGQLRTISRPRIVTMDNREAKIEDGESVPFETTSASGTSTIFVDANLSLTVTPHITPDGSVLMKIKASKNSIGTFTTSSGEPSIVKKEASTEVLVSDGETTVIGGIISSDSNRTDSGIPYLKDIPLFGKLFRSKSTKESQKELLIFITPTIIKTKRKG
jgi:type IV pilus assembly protein PilQ